MGYYRRSMYRGDYRGDLMDEVGAWAGRLGGAIDKASQFVPLVGGAVKAYNRTFSSSVAPLPQHPAMTAPGRTTPNLPPLSIQMVRQKGVKGGTPNNTPAQRREDRNDGGGRRRMNACNPKALRRAMRRTAAFMGFAKKYVKLVNPKAHVEMRHHPAKHHHHKK